MVFGSSVYGSGLYGSDNRNMEQSLKLTGKALYGISFATFFYYFGYQFYKQIFNKYGINIPIEEMLPTQEILVTGVNFLLVPFLIGTLIISKHDFIHALKASIYLLINKSEIRVNKKQANENVYHVSFQGIKGGVHAKLNSEKNEKDINFKDQESNYWTLNYSQFNEAFILVWSNPEFGRKQYSETSFLEQLIKTKHHEGGGDDLKSEIFQSLFTIFILVVLCLAFNQALTLGETSIYNFSVLTVTALLVAFIPSNLIRALLKSSCISLSLGFIILVSMFFITPKFFIVFSDNNFSTTTTNIKTNKSERQTIEVLFENNQNLIVYNEQNQKTYTIPKRNIEYIEYEPTK